MSSENPDTRTRILNAAWKLLESGDGAVRMSDIAKQAGISRQALYLHFPKRADLLVATTRHLDDVKNVDDRLAISRAATGIDRLGAFIEAWGNYIPEIHGVARALMAMQDSDAEAHSAWADRLDAIRQGCAAAIAAVAKANLLRDDLSEKQATDLLAALLSVHVWEQLRLESGWSQQDYISHLKKAARRALTTA